MKGLAEVLARIRDAGRICLAAAVLSRMSHAGRMCLAEEIGGAFKGKSCGEGLFSGR